MTTQIAPRKIGRPSKKTPEVLTEICERIASGQSLRKICEDKHIPTLETVRVWVLNDKEFSAQYALARSEQADYFSDEIVEMSDEAIGKPLNVVAAVRNAVDARKWVAAKLLPKKYGEKTGDITLNQQVNNFVVVSEAERQEMIERRKRLQNG